MSLEHATFGGGCFWCLEAAYEAVRGVREALPGYAGGHVEAPSYEQVCGGATGHAEVVRVAFDPAEIDYAELVRIFFGIHDPTTRDRQGADVGPQYRSIILTETAEQARVARGVIDELEEQEVFGAPIVTEVVPLERFWPAEAYHRRYFANNPGQAYCAAVVGPKLAKFRKQFADKLRG